MAKKDKSCNPCSTASWMMCRFLGAFMLLNGLKMLMSYEMTSGFMMGVANNMSFDGGMGMVTEWVSMLVAYTWPVASVLIGLSFLTCFKKCISVMTFMVYLLLFLLAHIWTGDMTGAIWDVLIVMYLMAMKSYCGMGMMCEKK